MQSTWANGNTTGDRRQTRSGQGGKSQHLTFGEVAAWTQSQRLGATPAAMNRQVSRKIGATGPRVRRVGWVGFDRGISKREQCHGTISVRPQWFREKSDQWQFLFSGRQRVHIAFD